MKFYQTIFILIILALFGGCTSKTTTYLKGITILGKNPEPKISNLRLQEIAQKIKQDTNASLAVLTTLEPNNEREIDLFLTNKYLKISFHIPNMFPKTFTNLGEQTKEVIEKIVPSLLNNPDIIIQIIGHAYDEGTEKEMQHYADLRAISVAELFFNSGLKQEILAKGCSNFIPIEKCDLTKPHTLCSMKNRRINIFIYTSKEDIITKCK